MTDHRSAITGQYVTAEHAAENPDTTVSERRDDLAAELDRLRGVNHNLQVALYGANVKIVELEADLDHLLREVRAAVHPEDAAREGGCESDLEPEPACLIHDTSGEDVRGWEMAECTCPRRSGHDGANSNSKAQLGVGLEPIAFDPPLTDDEAGAFLDAITTDEADQ